MFSCANFLVILRLAKLIPYELGHPIHCTCKRHIVYVIYEVLSIFEGVRVQLHSSYPEAHCCCGTYYFNFLSHINLVRCIL